MADKEIDFDINRSSSSRSPLHLPSQSWNDTSGDTNLETQDSQEVADTGDVLYRLFERTLSRLFIDASSAEQTDQNSRSDLVFDTHNRSLSNKTHLNLSSSDLEQIVTATVNTTANVTTVTSPSSSTMAPPLRFDPGPEILILDELNTSSVPLDVLSHNLTTFLSNSTPSTTLIVDVIDSNGSNSTDFLSERVCFASPEDYDLLPSVLCSSLFVLGVVFCTFGARCFRAFAFFLGAVLGGVATYVVLSKTGYTPIPPQVIEPEVSNVLVSLGASLIIGCLASLVNVLGATLVGVHFGALIGAAILAVIFVVRPLTPELQGAIPPSMCAIFAGVLALAGAIATINMPKGCTIITSSCYGAVLSMLCIDYFVEKFALLYWFRDHLLVGGSWTPILGDTNGPDSLPVTFCVGSQILLIFWALATLIGLIVQSCCTCRGVQLFEKSRAYEHVATTPSTMLLTPGSADITSTCRDKGKSVEDLHLEQKHRKYRYLYQVRTAHGDVLSQQYFQNMQNQKKLGFPSDQDTCTFSSDMSSHFLPESRTTTLSVA